MNPDGLITNLLVILTVSISGVGIEMANKPPASKKAKFAYRATFFLLGIILVGLTSWQTQRAIAQRSATEIQRLEAREESRRAAVTSAGEIGALRGQLGSLQNLMTGAMAAFRNKTNDPQLKRLAESYDQLAQFVAKPLQLLPAATLFPAQQPQSTNLELKTKAAGLFMTARTASLSSGEDEGRLQRNYLGLIARSTDVAERARLITEFQHQERKFIIQEVSLFIKLRNEARVLAPQLIARTEKQPSDAKALERDFDTPDSFMGIALYIKSLGDGIPNN